MEILNILYEYSYKNKNLDIDSINEICKLVIKGKIINESINFITNKNISRIDRYILGQYDMKNTIYIYHDQIKKFINFKIFKKR